MRCFEKSNPRIIPAHAGNSPRLDLPADFAGIIPAHAGNRVSEDDYQKGKEDHPRTCGEQFFDE